jgi:hypothetical protein
MHARAGAGSTMGSAMRRCSSREKRKGRGGGWRWNLTGEFHDMIAFQRHGKSVREKGAEKDEGGRCKRAGIKAGKRATARTAAARSTIYL